MYILLTIFLYFKKACIFHILYIYIYISLLFLGYYIMLFVLYLYKLYIYCITYIRSNEMHYYFKCRFRLNKKPLPDCAGLPRLPGLLLS